VHALEAALAQSKGLRNRVATFFEILTRDGNPGEQAAALKALLAQDPKREFVDEAIAYIRDPDSATGGRSSLGDKIDGMDRALLLHKIEHLQWQLDFREKHDKRYVTPKLDAQAKLLHYYEHELMVAREKIRSQERKITALHVGWATANRVIWNMKMPIYWTKMGFSF
jgi:hypothetical protein